MGCEPKLGRLDRPLDYCKEQERCFDEIDEASYFAGTIEPNDYGFVKIEGYLFASRREAQFEIMGRIKRAQRYLFLVLGKFKGTTVFTNRQRWRGFPVEITNFFKNREGKKGRGV